MGSRGGGGGKGGREEEGGREEKEGGATVLNVFLVSLRRLQSPFLAVLFPRLRCQTCQREVGAAGRYMRAVSQEEVRFLRSSLLPRPLPSPLPPPPPPPVDPPMPRHPPAAETIQSKW
eukprot:243462-Hanusia_phi.AAC.1